MRPIIDPRDGDVECDASSSETKSLWSLAGSLLAEISLPKLAVAWFVLLGFPALMLGAMPIVSSIWLNTMAVKLDTVFQGLIPAALLLAILIVGVFGGRRLFRLAERSFWSLNSLAVQPVYALCREILNQIADRLLASDATPTTHARWRSATAALAGIIVCLVSIALFLLVWPHCRFVVELSALNDPAALVKAALANSIAIVSAYVAVGALAWALADATMPQARDFQRFGSRRDDERTWRIAHLSDIHVVGGHYEFRIESGRSGPRGNDRLKQVFERLAAIHAREPLHAILVTGDITDAGLTSEWSEFLAVLAAFPQLVKLTLLIPGNHDVNVVNRANPAQFDLPTSPFKKLRKLRVLSTLHAVQGARVHVVDRRKRCLGETLDHALTPYIDDMKRFADTGRPRLFPPLDDLWANVFPMVLPPDRDDGLGIILMNSNADTHFSFTNALGMVSAEQFAGVSAAMAQYPRAIWIVCIHHHVVEYPRRAVALSERIGTALINGQWFARKLQQFANRIVVMHGHRHIDWFGECGSLAILSAPSTVMGDARDQASHFHIHTIAFGADSRLRLLDPQTIVIEPA